MSMDFCSMALDMLSIPVMSAEPERLFSEKKKTITAERHPLQPATVEAIESIKSFKPVGLSLVCTN